MVPNQVTGEGISSEDDIEVDAPQNVANYERSARLDAALASVMARGHEQLVADLKIQSHLSEGYVPSEVIVTLVLSGYRQGVAAGIEQPGWNSSYDRPR
ncbi:hypothetical protein [uncultured Herbaspirillum sp.]|uniref:hypothetical protein n=1 Tax=uncultured Herbaspirillum sp. TaxID=160236 RepID=UPI0026399D98|nr:hypothetical protein [uncultured Herbaspirillum sp.]